MNETTKLDLNFISENGKSKKFTVNLPKPDLTEEQVKEAMQSIIDAELCNGGGYRFYDEIKSARYVTTAVEDIFEAE